MVVVAFACLHIANHLAALVGVSSHIGFMEVARRVMDQAGWHIAHELEVPQNMRLVLLPPWSPEINPAEHIWDALREDCVGNNLFANLDAADKALSAGLRSLESDHARMRSLTGFKWITSISLNAN